jgi:hypothetical protein
MAGKKGNSGKGKYDWDALKVEYLMAEFINVSDFLRMKGVREDRTKTSGWSTERAENRRKIYEEISTEIKDRLKDNLELGYHNLLNIGILEKLNNPKVSKDLSVSDIEKLWKILRTEHGLPTQIKHLGEDQNSKFSNWIDNVKSKMEE